MDNDEDLHIFSGSIGRSPSFFFVVMGYLQITATMLVIMCYGFNIIALNKRTGIKCKSTNVL